MHEIMNAINEDAAMQDRIVEALKFLQCLVGRGQPLHNMDIHERDNAIGFEYKARGHVYTVLIIEDL